MRVLEFHAEQLSAAQAEWKRTRSPHNPSRTPYVLLGVVAAVALVLARLPSLLFDPGKLYFGAMTVGAELDRSVRLLNRGTSPVAIKDVVLTGDTSAFTISSDECRAKQLAAGQHCSLGLHFKSASEGPHEGKVLVSTDGGENSQELIVRGAGIDGKGRLVLSTTDVNFGPQTVGKSNSTMLTATNEGAGSVHISQITGRDPSKFSVDEKCSGRNLSRGEACGIRIDFSPVSEGAATSSLELADDTSESPHIIRVRGTGVAPPGPVISTHPAASVNPGSILFGLERVGAQSAERDITISNSGNAPLELHSLPLQDHSFTVNRDNCSGRTLSPNTTCNIAVAFGPAAPGNHSVELRLATNAPAGAIAIALSGLGVEPGKLSISPRDVDFGDIEVGHTRGVARRQLVVSNTGGSALNMGQTELQGSPDFTISNSSCQGRLEAGASCKLLVSFSPKAPGAQSAHLKVTAAPDENPQFAALRGSASAPPITPVAILRVTPPSLNFGQQDLFERRGATQNVTITNTGSGQLEITQVSIEGTRQDFHVSPRNCGSRLAPGAACSVTVTFTPRVPGNRTANLVLASNSAEPTAPVSLTGFGIGPPLPPPVALSISPRDVDFGSVDLGRTRSVARRQVVVNNTGGSALNVGRTEVQGSPDFAISNSSCQGRLDAGASCNVILSFSPNAAGTQSARLMVTTVPDAGPQLVTLRGSARASPTMPVPIMRVTPPAIDFGQQNIFERQRATQDITITNAGSGQLEIGQVSVEGARQDFRVSAKNCGSRLAPGAACSVTVMFTPRAPGNRIANLVLASNSAEPVAPVTLAGVGIRTPPSPPSDGSTGTSDAVGSTAQPSCWQPNAVRIYFQLLSKNSPSSGRLRATGVVVNQGTGASGPSPAQIELQQRDKGWHVVATRPISSLPPNASVTVTYDTDVRANDEFSPDYLLIVRFQPMGRERMRRAVAGTCNPQPSRIEQGSADARNLVRSSPQTPFGKRFDKRIPPPNNPPR